MAKLYSYYTLSYYIVPF